jgi:hypothetical protein
LDDFKNSSPLKPLGQSLLTDQDEISNLYRGPSIDASYIVSVHLAKQFQRRRFLKISQSETRIAYHRRFLFLID